MSVWTNPKLSWNGASDEFFNVVPDYQRIKGNIEYLNEYLPKVTCKALTSIYPMEEPVFDSEGNVTNIPYESFFNNIVYNIDILNNNLKNNSIIIDEYQYMRTYSENESIWDYLDLNKIESNLQKIKEIVDKYYNAKINMPLMLGVREEF